MGTPERTQIDSLLEGLSADRTSGAATLYRKILNYLVLGNLGSHDLPDRIRELGADMVPLTYLAGKLEKAEIFRWQMVAKNLLRDLRQENIVIAKKLIKILPAEGCRLLTHSNSSTVIEVLRSRRRQIEKIFQTIAVPGEEGRASCEQLKQAGIKVELIKDSRAPKLISEGVIPILGADCVTELFFVNKVGSAEIINSALEHKIEPVVVTGTEKLISSEQYGDRPDSPLFERIPLDGIMLVAGDYKFKVSRQKKKFQQLILKGKI